MKSVHARIDHRRRGLHRLAQRRGLPRAGARVTVFDNLSAGRRENLPVHDRLKLVTEGDIRSLPALRAAMAGVTHVLHLAAQVSVRASIDDPPNSCAHNVLGFVNVLDAARGGGVKRVVYASSAAVYGVPSKLPLDEERHARADLALRPRKAHRRALRRALRGALRAQHHRAALLQRLRAAPGSHLAVRRRDQQVRVAHQAGAIRSPFSVTASRPGISCT